MSLQAGQIVADKYRIVRMLGQGGMGEVYEGDNVRIHRRVAIKTLLAGVSSRGDVVQRFEREAQAAGRIGSEHIVEVLDMGDLPDGSRYMVMEFLEGTTLSDRIISRGRVHAREAARIVSELCEGLQAAHDAQIIHRDLKPANIFLLSSKQGRPDFVKILDFGVSKFSVLADEMSMTRTGAVVGTPYYMSPEQAKGAKFIDARSDLYSVGVILYETITGQVPFNAQTFNELIFKIALESPPPPESFVPDLDPHFASMVRKAMARDPNERFQSAAEFRHALEAWATAYDRASMSGALPVGGGAYLQGPAGGGRGGGTQILGPGPGFAQAQAVPGGQAGVGQGNPYAHASSMQQNVAAGQAHTAVAAPAAPARSSAGIAFVVALLVVLVGGGAAAAVVMVKRGKATATSTSTPTPTSTSTPSSTSTSTSTPTSTSTSKPTSVPGPETSALTSVSALPNASATPSAAPTASGHLPTGQGHVAQGNPTARPLPPATSQPTSKPAGGRSITGDL